MFKHPLLIAAVFLSIPAFADQRGSAEVATEIDSLPPNECRDRPAHVIALFTEYRNAKRFEFANDIVAKNINQMLSKPTVAPYVPKGGKCASDKTLSWAEKGSGDFYVAQCVMPAKGALFLMKFELDVPAGACLSDASIQSEVNSNMCKTLPAYPRQYLHTKIQTFECKVGNLPPPGQAPTFRNTPQAQVLDAGLFNRLVNAGIDISDMAEEKEGKIVLKSGSGTGSTNCDVPTDCGPPPVSGGVTSPK